MASILDFPPSPRLRLIGVDLRAIKARQQAIWASGDFAVIGTTLQIVGETLCEAAELDAGSRVLDVACGNGNATLAAARRFCRVTGLDYVPALLERARERAAAERLRIDFVEGDAEALPFAEAAFDVALSTFGVMFAPDQEQTAQELMRVVRRGGKIALANWTQEGFVGRIFTAVGKHVPPPHGIASPVYWGNEARLRQLFPDVVQFHARRRDFVFRYESFEHFVEVFRSFYGPIRQAFAVLNAARQAQLIEDMRVIVEQLKSPSKTRTLAIPGEYLEVVIDR